MGHIRLVTKTASNTYRLDVSPSWRALSAFNVERHRYLRHLQRLGDDAKEAGFQPTSV
jgi:hypothetical protein